MVKNVLTPKELAEAIGVSESSVRRWIDSGAMKTLRTVGGHRRIPLADAIAFLRESSIAPARPEALGLVAVGVDEAAWSNADRLMFETLCRGDDMAARSLVMSFYTAGQSLPEICDGALARAMHFVGELWQHSSRGIMVEHRAVELVAGLLIVLRGIIRSVSDDAPVAIGGAPEQDTYRLPSMMAGLVLADCGYRDVNYGPQTPLRLLAGAAEEQRARLVWLSLSSPQPDGRRAEIAALADQLAPRGVHLLVGGRRVSEVGLRGIKGLTLLNSMGELAAYARGLRG